MALGIETIESVLMEHFRCGRQKANFVANILRDIEDKSREIDND